ncbi:MAG TPA: CHAD domain-containing protein [Pirellulales bacterium]|nr:CHAD domain-containing protein [Pirellulales bacterium]
MAYRLKIDKSSKAGVRKIVHEQLDDAIRGLESVGEERANQVHDIRVRLKKLRAALRLVRSAIGGHYHVENVCFRDAAHQLSQQRDVQAAQEVLAMLADRARREGVDAAALETLESCRRRLDEEQQALAEQATSETWLRLAGMLRAAAERVDAWTNEIRDFETIAEGLENSYRRGRRAMQCALERPTPETLHEWRKQAKYHRYQVNLLEEAWPEAMKARGKSLKRLSDLLGDDHDLVVLREKLQSVAAETAADVALAECLELVDRRRGEILDELKPLGRWLYAEKPKQLRGRIASYWRIARSETNRARSRERSEVP